MVERVGGFRGKFSLYKQYSNTGGVTASQHFKLCSGRGAFPHKSKVLNEIVGALYLVSPWENTDNHNSNGHGVRGVGVRGGGHIRFDPLPPFTLNV